MGIARREFGKAADGTTVFLYTLTNENGITASFTDLGAIWVSMVVPDRNGVMADVVQGYDTAEAYIGNSAHFGAPIGRNANRIGNASFTLNGEIYTLAQNDGKNNLHSGPNLYHDRVWEVQTEEDELGSQIQFSLFSPDGDQGYPGNAEIHVTYTLTPDNAVMIAYGMTTDADTIANFTNHSYFNLRGHDAGDIESQQVQILADAFTPADAGSIPTGEIRPVEGTPMDFRQMKPIGQDIDAEDEQMILGRGFDHNWVLNRGEELFLAAKAYDEQSGRMMEVYTELPGMQFYTANFLNGEKGKNGAIYKRRSSYCFETQYFPDAINKPQFVSPVLKAGDEYHTMTVYQFLVK